MSRTEASVRVAGSRRIMAGSDTEFRILASPKTQFDITLPILPYQYRCQKHSMLHANEERCTISFSQIFKQKTTSPKRRLIRVNDRTELPESTLGGHAALQRCLPVPGDGLLFVSLQPTCQHVSHECHISQEAIHCWPLHDSIGCCRVSESHNERPLT